MTIIPHLIARYAPVLYAICAMGAFFYVWTAFQARRKEDIALFAMERDDAANRSRHSWLMASACVLLALGVYGVSNFIVPNIQLEEAQETPVIAILFTPIPSPTVAPVSTQIASPTGTFGPLPSVAPIATPLDRPPDTPAPPATAEGEALLPAEAACSSAGTQILAPGNSEQLRGTVEILGTASIPDFAFYKFEIQWPNSSEWVTLRTFETPVAGGVLGYWETSTLEPGSYRFRLVVVDQTGNYPPPCVIGVQVAPPTPEE